eukprot:GHVU01218564.1.p1 GENE.GHVU01218564.1~~GHVU01218564.1.p1  ORF type:complete len:108 (-),score=9.29 GHVU01218564.1:1017-1340(-)
MRVLPQMTNAHDGNSKVATTAALAESWSVWRESSMWKLLRGSLSGGLAKTCVYPLDRVKMVYQVRTDNAAEHRACDDKEQGRRRVAAGGATVATASACAPAWQHTCT